MRSEQLAGVLLAAVLAAPALSAQQGFPAASGSLAQCENRWVLLGSREPAQRSLAFIYVDPQMGFTADLRGAVTLGADGELARVPNPLEDKARAIMRVQQDMPAVCLDDKTIAALQLPSLDALIENYRDKRPQGQHLEAWATHYNHIGAVKQGLEFTTAALAMGHASAKLSFERGFAFNALNQFKEAESVLEPAVKEHPDDVEMIGELAYAHMGQGNLKRAIETYQQAIDVDRKGTASRRWEFAQNIAASYSKLGDREQTSKWLKLATQWKAEQEARSTRAGD